MLIDKQELPNSNNKMSIATVLRFCNFHRNQEISVVYIAQKLAGLQPTI